MFMYIHVHSRATIVLHPRDRGSSVFQWGKVNAVMIYRHVLLFLCADLLLTNSSSTGRASSTKSRLPTTCPQFPVRKNRAMRAVLLYFLYTWHVFFVFRTGLVLCSCCRSVRSKFKQWSRKANCIYLRLNTHRIPHDGKPVPSEFCTMYLIAFKTWNVRCVNISGL